MLFPDWPKDSSLLPGGGEICLFFIINFFVNWLVTVTYLFYYILYLISCSLFGESLIFIFFLNIPPTFSLLFFCYFIMLLMKSEASLGFSTIESFLWLMSLKLHNKFWFFGGDKLFFNLNCFIDIFAFGVDSLFESGDFDFFLLIFIFVYYLPPFGFKLIKFAFPKNGKF